MIPNPSLNRWFLIGVICCILTSCASYKNITYFKNVETSPEIYKSGKNLPAASFSSLKLQPDDLLKITITTLDPEFNGIANINNSQSAPPLNTTYSGISVSGDKYVDGYLINNAGEIDIPVLGRVHVAGMSVDEAKNKLTEKAAQFYKHAAVNIRLVNFRVTIIGEVARPGTYLVNEERISVLDALGLSGDLTIYGKRENIMLIRQAGDGQKTVVRFDLNDVNTMNSPFFYLKQGDVIYVEPGKGKAAATDMAATRTYAIAGSALAVLITLLSKIKF